MIELRPRDLFEASFRRRIRQSLGVKPVLLLGAVGAGAEDLARAEIERDKGSVLLEPTVDTTREEMVASLIVQIVRAATPKGVDVARDDSPAGLRARSNLARRYGPSASLALDAATGRVPPDWTLADAIGVNAGRQSIPPLRIAMTNAHRVPEPLLWELRDLSSAGRAVLVATTNREHAAARFGADSPFYGSVSTIELPKIESRMWTRALSQSFHTAEIDFLRMAARARAASTLEVLSFLEPGLSIESAWGRAVEARLGEAENVLNLAAAIHAFAPRLLRAIATRQAPYGAIPGAASQRIARALGKLRDLDLLEQPAPRAWQIADPVLGAALLARTR